MSMKCKNHLLFTTRLEKRWARGVEGIFEDEKFIEIFSILPLLLQDVACMNDYILTSRISFLYHPEKEVFLYPFLKFNNFWEWNICRNKNTNHVPKGEQQQQHGTYGYLLCWQTNEMECEWKRNEGMDRLICHLTLSS